MKNALITSVVLLALSVAPGHASIILFGTHTDHPIVPGLSLDDVRMEVDLYVNDYVAVMTFTNVSVAGETAVIEEIAIDGLDNDTGAWLLWSPQVLTSTADVSFSVSAHPNGVPGYQSETADSFIELQAKSSPVRYGLSAGESLEVRFKTSLTDGSDINDFLDAFGEGQDTAAYSIGFHAVSASVVDGESLSGVAVPEPGTIAVLAFGGLMALVRRRGR